MGTATIILTNDETRAKASKWVRGAKSGSVVTFKGPKRTTDQNSKMWAMLTDLATQLEWHGQKYSAEDWKDYAMHAMKRARWMPAEDGGMVPIGMRTSDLSVADMADLIALIEAFGASHGVAFPAEAA